MEVCGSVLVNSDYQDFRLKCIYCTIESELKDWDLFTYHVRTAHNSEGDDATNDEALQDFPTPQAEPSQELLDEAIAYEPDEFFEVIDSVDAEDQWLKTDAENVQYVEDDTLWSEATGPIHYEPDQPEFHPDTSEELPMQEDPAHSTSDIIEEMEYESGSDYSQTDDARCRRGPGRPPKRTRPEQVFKFKVSFIRSNPRVLHLIQAYKEYPCLWDPSDDSFNDKTTRHAAYKAIIQRMDLKTDVLLTVEELKRTLVQLHTQYQLAVQTKEKGKLVGMAARYLTKCEFLSVSPPVKTKSEDENNELIAIKLNFKEDNLVTSSFIETYANYPQLYNPALPEFLSIDARTQAYEKLAEEFRPVVMANETDVYIAVNRLRRWAYEAMRRLRAKELIESCSKQEVQYLRMCSFLPAKGSESAVLYCEHCEKRFHGDYNLRVHMFKAHMVGDLPYLCNLCPRRFDRLVDMERHKLRSHFDRKLKCEYCQKPFAVENDLKVHLLIHTGEKPHVCSICSKAFRLKLLLDHHINGVHLNLRPHGCHICPKSFRKKFELSNHIKGHLNIRDKKCEMCAATFYDHSSLSRHRRSHREEKKADQE
ncbi:hypothetical protein KR018_000872 [Drosophila ironensis]|nr:hypothetical protein KR018_000872 [Drosophila ironensis]